MESALMLDPPNELAFHQPFNRSVRSPLRLTNAGDGRNIHFKIKTTAPKRYCVRPNAGVVGPGETMEIEVILQPIPDEEKTRDKFQVQAQYEPADGRPVDWSDESTLMQTKLKCVFLPPLPSPERDFVSRPQSAAFLEAPSVPSPSVSRPNVSLADESVDSSAAMEKKMRKLEEDKRALSAQVEQLQRKLAESESKARRPARGVHAPASLP